MFQNLLDEYARTHTPEQLSPAIAAYLANLEMITEVAPTIGQAIVAELRDQRQNLKLIASENYSSLATQAAMGNLLTDKYAEGFPGHRFYAGCDNVDVIESYAANQACRLFGADHAYVQPHSGADANLVAYWAILTAKVETPFLERFKDKNLGHLTEADWSKLRQQLNNQRLLGMDYYAGGHLTHGYRFNLSAKMFEANTYGVDVTTGLIDYDAIEEQARAIKPLILLAGYSAYPRKINFARFREIADKVGAVLMVDMAHFAGLVAGRVFTGEYNPVPYADIVTTTTHKTLRGPRGGLILSKAWLAEYVDKGCPLALGGPLPHMMAAKAVAFTEASQPEFARYAQAIVTNAQYLAQACIDIGLTVATGGTDNHLFLVDVRPLGLTGRQAESALRECGITLNRNSLPNDSNGPWYTSGLRFGTPAVTTLGMDQKDMQEIASIIALVLKRTQPAVAKTGKEAGQPSRSKYSLDSAARREARERVQKLLNRYPIYPELDLNFLTQHFGTDRQGSE